MNIWLGGLVWLTIRLGQGLTFFQIGSHWQPSPFVSLSCNLSLSLKLFYNACSDMKSLTIDLGTEVWSFDGICVGKWRDIHGVENFVRVWPSLLIWDYTQIISRLDLLWFIPNDQTLVPNNLVSASEPAQHPRGPPLLHCRVGCQHLHPLKRLTCSNAYWRGV